MNNKEELWEELAEEQIEAVGDMHEAMKELYVEEKESE